MFVYAVKYSSTKIVIGRSHLKKKSESAKKTAIGASLVFTSTLGGQITNETDYHLDRILACSNVSEVPTSDLILSKQYKEELKM